MRSFLFLALVVVGFCAKGQQLAGRILGVDKKPIFNAHVLLYRSGIPTAEAVTDFSGEYVVQTLEIGVYDLVVGCAGYDSLLKRDVFSITSQSERRFDFILTRKNDLVSKLGPVPVHSVFFIRSNNGEQLWPQYEFYFYVRKYPEVSIDGARTPGPIYIKKDITGCKMPEYVELLNDRQNPTRYRLGRKELNRLPYTNVNDAISMLPGVYQQQLGAGLSIYGSR